MMRSLYAGVSGLQNHQIRMDVIGNNISNVNTTGFKKGRVNFHDMISQTLSGAARPTEEVGGVNPKQVGLGMTIASIDTIHTQGSLQTTGVMTDVAVQGEGFFILRKGDRSFYTRAGVFGLDEEGYLVNPANGLRVQGWRAETVNGQTFINTTGSLQDLIIPVGSKDPASATTEVFLACNLDKRLPEIPPGAGPETVREGTWVATYDIYDSFGNPHTLRIEFTKVVGEPNRWRATVTVDPDAETPTNTLVDVGETNNATNTFIIQFDNLGTIQSVEDEAGDVLDAGALQVQVGFDVPEATIPPGEAAVRQTFNLNLGQVGSVVDAVTQFAERSSTKVFRQNGYTMGYLEGFKIDQNGVITGVYSNGNNRPLGQIALATFVNPGGLEKEGETMFRVSLNSGDPNVGPPNFAGKGKLIAGALEMSNVDLAEAFTDMIVTQRGFQANSRTITTSDQMLQELLTLKR
ncbi:flagellar hook-basal body protein [Spirochaeta thermophila DSM 6578]|uniref:Flagellar hook protein FlgE n=1 Tax=Winmispira thermophila (strain ATCC 700085 / DSM 6578 / Z-1203) TaxID=869211 RepID=G0GCD2_WINT7|nr:flagellar hook protein FlgE [Spirochaeta thermophila]AEJ61217.1 flagellar hook-basal body protein [Spirochaeta thermophila DSM 6578]